jgi:hypothetical protein
MGTPTTKPLAATVGDFPDVDGDQPMSDAELRMVREFLGITAEWLADHLGVALRTVRRWEHGTSPVPDGVRVQVEALEEVAARQVGELVDRLAAAADVVLTIPREDGEWPAGWWRMVAARVAVEVPGLEVHYREDPDE